MSITIPPVMTAPAPATNPGAPVMSAGLLLGVLGGVSQTIGAFYGARAEQTMARSAALDARFASSMANINARQAEQDAQQILRAGEQEIGTLGLATAAERAAMRVDTAASGIEAGTGSALEAAASLELRSRIEAMTIRLNSVRAAGQARTGAVNARNQQMLSGVSARNLEGSAKTIRPGVRAAATALQVGGYMAPQWYANARRN